MRRYELFSLRTGKRIGTPTTNLSWIIQYVATHGARFGLDWRLQTASLYGAPTVRSLWQAEPENA